MRVPMNRAERQYIEYRPQLGFRVNVQLLLEDMEREPDQIYEAPPEILEASQHLASDVFENANAAIQAIDNLMDKLGSNLADAGGAVPFSVYRENPTPEEKEQFENFHANDVNGKLDGELYPILQNVKDEVTRVRDFLNDELYDGRVDMEDIESLRDQEAKEIEAMVRQDIEDPGSQPLAELKTRTEMVRAIAGSIDAASSFVEQAESLINQTANDMLGGHVDSVITNLSGAPSLALQGVKTVSNIEFAQHAAETEAIKESIERLAGSDVQELMFKELSRMRELKLEMQEVLNWLDTVDTQYDTSPITDLVEQKIETIEAVLDEYDAVLIDMERFNLLKGMQYQGLADSLSTKEKSRQTSKIVTGMQENFDFEDDNLTRQVNRFIDNAGLTNKRL